jgi:hypothetical protein
MYVRDPRKSWFPGIYILLVELKLLMEGFFGTNRTNNIFHHLIFVIQKFTNYIERNRGTSGQNLLTSYLYRDIFKISTKIVFYVENFYFSKRFTYLFYDKHYQGYLSFILIIS